MDPGLDVSAIAHLVRPGTEAPGEWATAVRSALMIAGQLPDADHACQVLAIIEQESGYEADPAVHDLARVVALELEAEVRDKLGFLGPGAIGMLLDVAPEGEARTFRQRMDDIHTERDLDLFFRELMAYHESRAPTLARGLELVAPRLMERLNPVRTAGSMQVQVSFAQEHELSADLGREAVRDQLYSLEGGVRYGTLRLFAFEAGYDQPIYRFADYNAGLFASRNAAFQDALSQTMGAPLDLDGDLLIWNDRGHPTRKAGETLRLLQEWRATRAPELSESRMKKDLQQEKEHRFEQTQTWAVFGADWASSHGGKAPVYARIPEVTLDSPKLKGQWTTRDFAERVDKRYRACMQRGGATPP